MSYSSKERKRGSIKKHSDDLLVRLLIAAAVFTSLIGFSGCDTGALSESGIDAANINIESTLDESGDIPQYEGDTYVTVNDNEPSFSDEIIEMAEDGSFEEYGSLDTQGRCEAAVACLSTDTMPDEDEERGDISSVHPSGWQSGYRWERCHLIGWQLSAENANEENLITGTHYMNVSGMLPFENEVADYIKETDCHVLYEVIPVYSGDDLIASGVQIQAMSVEDNGIGLSFNVYCFNVSPGYYIDYDTGVVTPADTETRTGSQQTASGDETAREYVLNIKSMKFHYPSCSGAKATSDKNKRTVTESRSELIEEGYAPCGQCEP